MPGAGGFIGSHLVAALIARGDSVTVYDDVSTGTPANLAAVMDHERFRFVRGNICDAYTVDELVREHDIVMHLAAAVGVRLPRPVGTASTSVRCLTASDLVCGRRNRPPNAVCSPGTRHCCGRGTPISGTVQTDGHTISTPRRICTTRVAI